MSAELVLHLDLNGFEVVNQQEIVKDVSGKNHVGTLQGHIDIVADDTFGACASFDGKSSNYITVPSDNFLRITGDITGDAWVYVSQEASDYVRIVGRGSDPRDYGLWSVSGGGWLFQRYATQVGVNAACQIDSPTRALNTWYHLAGVIEGTKGALYLHDLQGKCIGYKEIHDMPAGPDFDTDQPLTIGYNPDLSYLSYPAHTGRIAHVRVYNGTRSQAEIEQGIASDRLALVPFRKSHPIDFRLYDDDDQAVLYISDDPDGHNLHPELHNTSKQIIHLCNGPNAVASETNHHFAVRFRPGTLSVSTLTALGNPQERANILQPAEQWEAYFPPKPPAANETASLYLLYKGPEKDFKGDERRTLTLQRMSAAPGNGTRGTQVELLPHQLTAAGGDATPITGSRTQYVHITNHMGHKNIPLHVWFEGGNTVLNDGVSSTDLTLCISNASGDRDITLNAASQFLISFDVGGPEEAAWALTTPEHESNVHVKYGQTELPRTAAEQGISRQWSLQFPQGEVLQKRGSAGKGPLKITIEGIQTSPGASGHANLYVRYDHIPGYQDGQFILTVEKSPLVSHQNRVGIGTTDPQGKLHIKGSPLVIEAQSDAAGNTPRLCLVDTNASSGVTAAPAWGVDHVQDRFRILRQENLLTSGVERLSIDKDGNVGIGTPDPKTALQIGNFAPQDTYLKVTAAGDVWHRCRAGIKLECGQHNDGYAIEFNSGSTVLRPGLTFSQYRPDSTEPRLDLFLDRETGNVGIGGTMMPEKTLEVRGELQVRASHNNSTADIGAFYAQNKTQGIGIGYNQIAAIGSNPNQQIAIKPKGTGSVVVEGPLRVNGPFIIHTENITTASEAEKVLGGTKNSIVFFVDSGGSPHLNWGFVDSKGTFHSSWAS